MRACREALPHAERPVGVGYGLTECSGLATSASDDVLREHPDSVGAPIPTCELAIHDDDDNPLPDGEIGNVMLRGPMVTPGYWDNPEATAETIRPGGWLRTGDFGRHRERPAVPRQPAHRPDHPRAARTSTRSRSRTASTSTPPCVKSSCSASITASSARR